MFIPVQPQNYSDGVVGDLPVIWAGQDAVDGTAEPWISQPIGSIYVRFDAGNVGMYLRKLSADATADWKLVTTA